MGLIRKRGATWLETAMMRWNGSAWVRASVKVWNGSMWKLIQGASVITTTINATSYETRAYETYNQVYLRTVTSATTASPMHIGGYEETTKTGYIKFDWGSGILRSDATKLPVKATLRANILRTANAGSSEIDIDFRIMYSDSTGGDGSYWMATIYNTANGTFDIDVDSILLAKGMMHPYNDGTRRPFAIETVVYHSINLSSEAGVTVSNMQLILTYEE